MFSFFKSKKSNVDTDPIPAAATTDDYIFVEKKDDDRPSPYPTLSGPFGGYNPPAPGPQSPPPISNYLQGVPFKLSPELEDQGNSQEITRFQVDEILSYIKRIESSNVEYGFGLEKEVLTQE